MVRINRPPPLPEMDDLSEFGEGDEYDLTSGEWLYCLEIVNDFCCGTFLEFCRVREF